MLATVNNTPGRTDLVGMLTRASDGLVYDPTAKTFVAAPTSPYLPLTEFPAPNPGGWYRWLDANVPAPASNDEYLFFTMAKSTTPTPIYSTIGEPLTIAPYQGPCGLLLMPAPFPFWR